MADLQPITVHCPTCGTPIEVPARIWLYQKRDPERDEILNTTEAHLHLDLDPAREHHRVHEEAMPAVLAYFGVFW